MIILSTTKTSQTNHHERQKRETHRSKKAATQNTKQTKTHDARAVLTDSSVARHIRTISYIIIYHSSIEQYTVYNIFESPSSYNIVVCNSISGVAFDSTDLLMLFMSFHPFHNIVHY